MAQRMRITLVDPQGSLAEAVERQGGWEGVHVRPWTDVRDVTIEPGMAFVSPANSLGFMDGGIDYVLSREMFHGIEARVKEAYKESGHLTLLGRPHLPIGKAVVVPLDRDDYDGACIISAPTMWLPQDVRGTHNAYHAMHAILQAAHKHDNLIDHIVLCGLCTGCGMMDADTAISQMKAAHHDYIARPYGPFRYTLKQIVDEQPNYYENTEWKHIDPREVVVVNRQHRDSYEARHRL